MSIPDFQSLMLPVLQEASRGEVRIGEVVDRLAIKFNLTIAERAELLPSGKQRIFVNRVHWSKAYLAKAMLIENTKRAHFRITKRGSDVLATKTDRIDTNFLTQFPEFEKFRSRPNEIDNAEPLSKPANAIQLATPDEIIRSAHHQIEASLKQDLLDRVRSAPPEFFERLIVNLLLSMGYGGSFEDAGRALGRSGDGGVDGVIDQDALGLDRVYIQAKRYEAGNTVGPSAIRDFFGSLDDHKAAKGLFATTSVFTTSAIDTAKRLSKRIVLIDGDQLARLMIRYNVGCRIEDTLHIKKIDEDFFD